MYYNNPYNRKKPKKNFLKRISMQLMAVLIIMLLLLMFKYVKSTETDKINKEIKNMFYTDFTDKAIETYKSSTSGNFLSSLTGKNSKNEVFLIDALPADGKVVNTFGTKVNPKTNKEEKNNGIDIDCKEGSNIKVVAAGKVESIENDKTEGLVLVVIHNNGIKTYYGQLAETKVVAGDEVKKNDIIATAGKKGLHFEISSNNNFVDPMSYLKAISN